MTPNATRHVPPILAFGALTSWWLWALLSRLCDVVPGAAAGDNLTFVWNVWWVHYAAAELSQHFLFCPLLLYPFGAELTLHTHTLLPALAAAPLTARVGPVAAQNAIIALHLFFNFVSCYALAFHVTRHRLASMLAAVIFGWSPYISAHLLGHFNLIGAWILPLAALLSLAAADRRTWTAGALLGVALGAAAYMDYYYFAYGVLASAILLLGPTIHVSRATVRTIAPWQSIAAKAMIILLAIDVLIIVWIAATGGGVLTLGDMRISLRTPINPIAGASLLALVWIATRQLPRVRFGIDAGRFRSIGNSLAATGFLLLVILAPLIVRGADLWRSGNYVTQRYFWRSAPAGIDLATLVLGNPFGQLSAIGTRAVYSWRHVDMIENGGWLGPGVMALCAIAIARGRRDSAVRRWIAIASVFFVWALGPYLTVLGSQVYVALPAVIVRWLPIINNARIPGRAMIVVYLASAVLGAVGITRLSAEGTRSRLLACTLAVLVLLDYTPRTPPLYEIERPAVYEILRLRPDGGAVCELPLGLRDGFGEVGRFDSRTMLSQTVHEHPMLGGFVARIPPGMSERYLSMPVVGALLRLSGGGSLAVESVASDRKLSAEVLGRIGIRYFVVNRTESSPDLIQYMHEVLPLSLIAEEGGRSLYVVKPGTVD